VPPFSFFWNCIGSLEGTIDVKPHNPRKAVRGALRFEHWTSQLEFLAVDALSDSACGRYIF
jgi:hypothetical protein